MRGHVCLIALFCATSIAMAYEKKSPEDFEHALHRQAVVCAHYLSNNISRTDGSPGAVVASPSYIAPNYYFHWVRDAAIVMDMIVALFQHAPNAEEKAKYEKILFDYARFSRQIQRVENPSGGLGEPKFNMDGTAFTGAWGRPQNDGPAMRAVSMIKAAKLWVADEKIDFVKQHLYDGLIPTHTLIKADLEYTAHHWREKSFDVWEEVMGHHFYNRLVQRRAMIEGAAFATQLDDRGAADFYLLQAREMEADIAARFWDSAKGVIIPSTDQQGRPPEFKLAKLDTVVLLGVLHAAGNDGYFAASDQKVLSTVARHEAAFHGEYDINHHGFPATALGRYPFDDTYDGYGTKGEGNPWFIPTSGVGEIHHRAATQFEDRGEIAVTAVNAQFFKNLGVDGVGSKTFTYYANDAMFDRIIAAMRARGESFIERTMIHVPADGSMAEQINRYSGYNQGAPLLSWSFTAFLSAYLSRPGQTLHHQTHGFSRPASAGMIPRGLKF